MNLANLVTCSRVLMIPLVIVLYYAPIAYSHEFAAVLFAIASITDWLDGFLARRLNQTSPFGAFLDPVADKLLVVVAMVLLVANFNDLLFVLATAIIIGREVFVSALREWMANLNKRNLVAVGYIGKVKTTVQMVAITILIAVGTSSPAWLVNLGFALVYLSAFFSLWSMATYLRAALPVLSGKGNE